MNGKWWTPTNPNKTVAGAMTFDPSKGAILELGGLLQESETCAMPFEIVLGQAEDGRAITLIGSIGTWLGGPYRIADNGEPDVPACSSLCANVLLIGKHCPSPQEIKFSGFTVDLTNLYDWAICAETDVGEGPSPEPVALEFEIGGYGRVRVESDKAGSCHLKLATKGEVGLNAGIELIRQIRNLMALLHGRFCRAWTENDGGHLLSVICPCRERKSAGIR